MAAYIPVPRDLTRVKTKVFFNLTKRQLICVGAAAIIGLPSFFLLKALGNVSLASLGMIVIMLPLFLLASMVFLPISRKGVLISKKGLFLANH